MEKLPSEDAATEVDVPLTVIVAPETGVSSFVERIVPLSILFWAIRLNEDNKMHE
jgi:hypothetical protein